MAKYTAKFTAKGILDLDLENEEVTITTIKSTRDGDVTKIYDVLSQLKAFNGKEVNFSITEDIEVDPVEEL